MGIMADNNNKDDAQNRNIDMAELNELLGMWVMLNLPIYHVNYTFIHISIIEPNWYGFVYVLRFINY